MNRRARQRGFVRRPRQSQRGVASTAFDPSSLALTSWFRDYAASPWAGTASAGTSGAATATEATNAPSSGSALNGHPAAVFDGTNDILTLNGTLDTYYNASALSGWVLVDVTAVADIGVVSKGAYTAIFSATASARHGVYIINSGGVYTIGVYVTITGALARFVETTFALAAPKLVQWKSDGVDIWIRINGGAWIPGGAGSGAIDNLTMGVAMGRNVGATRFFNGNKYESATTDMVLSDATFDSVLTYARDRYAIALT